MHESKDPSKLQVSLAQTWMNSFLAFFFFLGPGCFILNGLRSVKWRGVGGEKRCSEEWVLLFIYRLQTPDFGVLTTPFFSRRS